MKPTVQVWAAPAAMALLLMSFPVAAKEGFSLMSKKVAPLARVSPPAVYLMGSKVQVKVSGSSSVQDTLVQSLQTQLESELISRDSRLTVDTKRPEVLIEVSILQNDHKERWEERQETRLVSVGKDAKGKPVFETRQVTVRYKIVSHTFAGSYKVSDRVKGASLDADSLRYDYSEDFEDGKDAPEVFSLEASAIGRAVDLVARRITPTRETIGVLIPKGSLEDLANLAVAGQWNLYLEALERKPPLSKPIDESYRQYALGVSYEALGYAAEDPADTLKYLEQASGYYNRALESNPGEKFFTQAYDSLLTSKKAAAPLERVQTALANYRKVKNFVDQYAALQAGAPGKVTGGKTLDARSSGADEMNNAAVIRMVRADLPNEVILTAIETAAKPSFDVSAEGLIALSEANVDMKIIQRIQEIGTGKKKSTSAKSAAPKPVVKKPAAGKTGQ